MRCGPYWHISLLNMIKIRKAYDESMRLLNICYFRSVIVGSRASALVKDC